MRRAVPVCLAAWALACAAAPDEVLPSVEVDEPRAFGHALGDLVERRITVQLPPGFALDPGSVPEPGRRGQAIELRRIDREALDGDRRLRLVFVYQVFAAPPQLRLLELPPVALLAHDAQGREQSLRVDAWPLSVGPLAPEPVFSRRGLGELRPDVTPVPIPTAALEGRLLLYAGLAAGLLLGLAQVYVGWWPGRARRRPFARAWRALRRLPAVPTPAQRRAAFRTLHEALNRSAGEVLFAGGVGRFVAAHPRFAPLQGELDEFFRRSQAEFFADGGADDDARWLRQLGRACRNAERGSG